MDEKIPHDEGTVAIICGEAKHLSAGLGPCEGTKLWLGRLKPFQMWV